MMYQRKQIKFDFTDEYINLPAQLKRVSAVEWFGMRHNT